MSQSGCLLCGTDGGLPIFSNDQLPMIQALEPGFTAWYRMRMVLNFQVCRLMNLIPVWPLWLRLR